MTNDFGPHLLGRNPSPPDHRDYNLADYLATDPLDDALANLLKSPWRSQKVKDFAKILVERIHEIEGGVKPAPVPPSPSPSPTPTPTPTPSGDVVWIDSDQVLDQGQTGHCVGFGSAQWGNTLPVDDHFKDADGHKLYYECKVIDGEPNQENGSNVRSGMIALQNRGRLKTYASARTFADIQTWLQTKGPIVFGTDWDNSMFNPDANGYVKPDGNVAGGHCYLCIGDLVSEGAFEFLNSWGDSWADHGRFKMKYADVKSLLARQGEAWAAVEI